ncbi:MAG: hypothetical protein HKN57_02545 [Xanthomonadales bacterium]|nr:hypothetical protein [Xanthomonadales bacterium]
MVRAHASLAVIMDSAPYQSRAARDDVDFVLAAAALDFELRIYFPGPAILQLAADRDASGALLPGGYRAWAALPDLSPARIFAEKKWAEFCANRGLDLVLPFETLNAEQMKQSWRLCDHAVVL